MKAAGGRAHRLATCVGHHVVHTRDVKDVAGVLLNVDELPLLRWCPGIREAAQSRGEGAMVVQSWRWWPSTWNLKCQMALKAAESSLSKAL